MRGGFRAGKNGDAARRHSFRCFAAAREVGGAQVDVPESLPATKLSSWSTASDGSCVETLILAALEAWKQSGWAASEDLPLVLGTTSGGMGLGEAYYRQAIHAPKRDVGQAERVNGYQAQRQALDVADALGFSGPITMIANACASGANSIGHAWDLIRRGRAERVFTGGYDAISQMVFGGFDSLQALSPTSCRPFDAKRDGLALGEGAAMLTLETLDSAKKRGAEILGEIVGYGATPDAHTL